MSKVLKAWNRESSKNGLKVVNSRRMGSLVAQVGNHIRSIVHYSIVASHDEAPSIGWFTVGNLCWEDCAVNAEGSSCIDCAEATRGTVGPCEWASWQNPLCDF